MSGLEFNNMPDDNLLENDTSTFDNPLNGNDLNTPSNTTLNRSPEEPESGASGTPDTSSRLIGPLITPETSRQPRTASGQFEAALREAGAVSPAAALDALRARERAEAVASRSGSRGGARIEAPTPPPTRSAGRVSIPGSSEIYTPTRPDPAAGGSRGEPGEIPPAGRRNMSPGAAIAEIRTIPGLEDFVPEDLEELSDAEVVELERRVGTRAIKQMKDQAGIGGANEKLIPPGPNAREATGTLVYRRRVGGTASEVYPTDPDKLMVWVRERLLGEESLLGENPTPEVQERKQQLETLLVKLGSEKEDPRHPRTAEEIKATKDLLKKINAEVEASENLHNIYRNFRDQLDGNGIYNQLIKLRNRDQDTLYNMPGVWEVVKSLDLNADKLFGATDDTALNNFYDTETKEAARTKIREIYPNLSEDEVKIYAESAHIKGLRLWEMKRGAVRDKLIRTNTLEELGEDDINDSQLFLEDGNVKWKKGPIRWRSRTRFNSFNAMRRLFQLKEAAAERLEPWKLKSVDILEGMRGEPSKDFYTDYADKLETRFKDYIIANSNGLSTGQVTRMAEQLAVMVIGVDKEGRPGARKWKKGTTEIDANGNKVFVESKNNVLDIQNMKMTSHEWDIDPNSRDARSKNAFFATLGNMDQTKKEELFESLFSFDNLQVKENVMEVWGNLNIRQADPRREALFSLDAKSLATSPGEKSSMHAMATAAYTPGQVEAIAVATADFMHMRLHELTGDRNWNFDDIKGYMNRVAANNDSDKYPPIDRKKVNDLAIKSYLGEQPSDWQYVVAAWNKHPNTKNFLEIMFILLSRFGFDLSRKIIRGAFKEMGSTR